MSLKMRLLLFVFGLMLLAITAQAIITTSLTTSESTDSLRALSKDRLVLQSVQTREAIDDYLKIASEQIINLSASSVMTSAASDFSDAYRRYDNQRRSLDSSSSRLLNDYYTQRFAKQYQDINDEKLSDPTRLLTPLNSVSKKLQHDYIAGSRFPLGEKDKLLSLNNGTDYDATHSQYHPEISSFLNDFGYYDIFIADAASGDIIYSVFKELDYATNLKNGPYARSGIGEVFRLATQLNSSDQSVYSKLDNYLPSYDAMAGFLASPITDSRGRTVAILIFQIPLDEVSRILTHDRAWSARGLGSTGETFLVSPDKLLVSESRLYIEKPDVYLNAIRPRSPEIADTIEEAGTTVGRQPVNSSTALRALQGETGFDEILDRRDQAVLSYFSPLKIGNYTYALLSEMDVSEALAPAYSLRAKVMNYTVITAVIILVVAAAAVFWMATSLVKPLSKLGDACTDLSEGEGDLTVRLPRSAIPEINRIVAPFNQFISQVHELVTSIHNNADTTASAAEELSVTMHQSKQLSHEQRDETHMVATSIEELSASIADVTRSTVDTRDQGVTARASLKENMERTNIAAENVKLLVNLLTSSSSVINTLKDEVNQITGLLNDITAIADQTNLLALNAAIEAARAGEAGRGFSVVADEVRALATRSQSSTVEIAKIVESMNQSSEHSVREMEKATTAADGGIHLIDLVSTAMNELSMNIDRVQQMGESVASASEEQEATSKNLSQNVIRISEMAMEIDTAAQQSDKAAEELANIASQSKELVARFKL